jgi:hypothetical protein
MSNEPGKDEADEALAAMRAVLLRTNLPTRTDGGVAGAIAARYSELIVLGWYV